MSRSLARVFVASIVASVVCGATRAQSGGELGNYRFENGVPGLAASQPGSILDSSPAAVNGDPHGDPLWSSDVPGASVACVADAISLEFDGVDDWLSFASPFAFDAPSADVTLEFWIKAPDQPHRPIFWTADPAQPDSNRFHLFTSPGGVIGLDYRQPDATLHTLLPGDGTFTIPLDTWTHVAVTRVVESNSTHTYRFYENGVLVHTSSDSSPNLPTSSMWMIGRRNGTLQTTFWFTGELDEIRISDHALLPSEFLISHPPTTYCTSSTTTNGCEPAISGTGTPSATATSGFNITVTGVEGQKNGLIFYGTSPTAVAWAIGSYSYVCVAPPVQRTPITNTGGTLGGCDGVLTIDFNAFMSLNPTAYGNPFMAGEVFYAQGWFRDPGAVKGTNLSNGLSFRLCN